MTVWIGWKEWKCDDWKDSLENGRKKEGREEVTDKRWEYLR